jgi:hypothetical protein
VLVQQLTGAGNKGSTIKLLNLTRMVARACGRCGMPRCSERAGNGHTVKGTLYPANAMSRCQVPPMYDRSPVVVSSVSWKGGRPSICTVPLGSMCLPPRIFNSVVLPAPLAPSSRHLRCTRSDFLRPGSDSSSNAHLLPAGSDMFMSCTSGAPGDPSERHTHTHTVQALVQPDNECCKSHLDWDMRSSDAAHVR